MSPKEGDLVWPSRQMSMGDRILVEPPDMEPFEATVHHCRGWGIVNGVMDWVMTTDDGNEFIYSIHINASVHIIGKEK